MHGFGRSEQAEAEQSYSAAPSSLSREAASIDGGKEGREGQGRMTSVGRSSEAREKRREQRNDDRPNQLSLSQARTCTYRSFSSSRKMAKATAALPGGMRRGGGRLRAMHVDERPETETYIERRRSNKTTM